MIGNTKWNDGEWVPLGKMVVRVPAAVDQAMQFDNIALWREMGARFGQRYIRRGKGDQIELTATPIDLARIADAIRDRIAMNGGEGYEDSQSALRAAFPELAPTND